MLNMKTECAEHNSRPDAVQTENCSVETGQNITFPCGTYRVLKLLGRGKGGYSWLAAKTESGGTECADQNDFAVLKQIHHEPCDYYSFGDKFQSELNDYETLASLHVPVPKLICHDRARELILKEYIDGETAEHLAKTRRLTFLHTETVHRLSEHLKAAHINIDWYPTNFIIQNGSGALFYIDYECNAYDEKWSFENWGKNYWHAE